VSDLANLEAAVGKLILGKVAGTELTNEEIDLMRSGTIGGVTLFRANADSLEQLAALVQAIRRNMLHDPIIAVDQEGGAVQRFDKLITPLPSAMAVAATGNLDSARAMARLSARELKLLGLNCLLTPALDVLSNSLNPVIGTRSFGSDPHVVREYGMAVCQSLHASGIMAVGKHFPGHGDTLEDSHKHLAVNRADARTLWQRELVPFRGCLQYLPAVLTGHIWLPSVDSDMLPASLSERVTTGMLRHYLGFDGLIFTDDLLMDGVQSGWGLGEAAVKAVLAGADVLLVCGDVNSARTTHAAIVEAVSSGRIHQSAIRKAGERISRALNAVGHEDSLEKDDAQLRERLRASITAGRTQALAVSAAAVTVLRGCLPDLASNKWIVLAPEHPLFSFDLVRHLKALRPDINIAERRYPLDPDENDTHRTAGACSGANVLYLTFRAIRNHGQIDLATALAPTCRSNTAIITDVPYDLIGLHGWQDCLATFDPSDLAMEALAQILAGQESAAGKCPVTLGMNL